MRKSTLFISAALTTFMLAVMFGVASAYQKIVQDTSPTEVAVQQQVQPTDVIPATATNIAGGAFTAEQAANLASNVIGRTDLYTAEIAQLDGVDTYLVTFSSGDIVYVSMNGQILSISKLPVTIMLDPSSSGSDNHNGSNYNGNSNGNSSDNYNNNGDDNYSDNHDDDNYNDNDYDDGGDDDYGGDD